ncbi:MAG: DegT/DnrJ/EryC1/StrS family aminotransferase [Candidatus Peregrinibacteria bacterium]|nr:DegT/DnrJ/EryC1/StrS family aminotransferase [Candidatus Peregrinibacteria bacterium]
MIKIVSNQVSPNLNFSDFFVGLGAILFRKRHNFEQFFGSNKYVLTNSARTGLGEIIDVLNLSEKNKVVGIPAFICGVVATPFLEAGFKVVWIDTDKNGLLDFDNFKKKSDQISVLVAPHIFGQKLDLSRFAEVCRKKNIFLIEDCAHNFVSGEIKNADARILSFGREKVFSCVSGGAVVWKESFDHKKLTKPPFFWTFRHLFQILIFSIAIPFWQKGGKILPWIFRKIGFLPLAVTTQEKLGMEDFPRFSMPVPMQRILKRQFAQTKKINTHRKSVAEKWTEIARKLWPEVEIIVPKNCFRVILKFKNKDLRDKVLKQAKKVGFDFRDWDGVPIAPAGVDLERFGYMEGSCPQAEEFANIYLTLPTNIRTELKDLEEFEKQLDNRSTDQPNNFGK